MRQDITGIVVYNILADTSLLRILKIILLMQASIQASEEHW